VERKSGTASQRDSVRKVVRRTHYLRKLCLQYLLRSICQEEVIGVFVILIVVMEDGQELSWSIDLGDLFGVVITVTLNCQR